jgi:hypothetical protein
MERGAMNRYCPKIVDRPIRKVVPVLARRWIRCGRFKVLQRSKILFTRLGMSNHVHGMDDVWGRDSSRLLLQEFVFGRITGR